MKTIRRGLLAVALGSMVAAVLRLKGSTGVPPQGGGWRELSGAELK